MKVKELIEKLSKFDGETDVVIPTRIAHPLLYHDASSAKLEALHKQDTSNFVFRNDREVGKYKRIVIE